jgi:hypothetical protein
MSNLPTEGFPSLSIELGTESSKPYKSIQRVVWRDIPPFAILTGRNGSGKTQFLQVLAHRLCYPSPLPPHMVNPSLRIEIPLRILGPDIGPHEVAYLPSVENMFRVGAMNISNLHQAKQSFLQGLTPQNVANNIEAQIMRERVQRQFGIRIEGNPAQEMIDKLPDDFTYMLEYGDVSTGLSHVFFGYQVRLAERLLKRQPEEKIVEELGQPPWVFVNDALAAAEFGYRI